MLEEVERLIKNGKIIDTVIAQIGNTKFKTDLDSKHMHLIEFTTQREIEALIQNFRGKNNFQKWNIERNYA